MPSSVKYRVTSKTQLKQLAYNFIKPPALVIKTVVSSVIIMEFGFNDHHITMAQQQSQVNLTSAEKQLLSDGISFQIDNVNFS